MSETMRERAEAILGPRAYPEDIQGVALELAAVRAEALEEAAEAGVEAHVFITVWTDAEVRIAYYVRDYIVTAIRALGANTMQETLK